MKLTVVDSFGLFMLFGAIVTQLAVPDSGDATGESTLLEQLAQGQIYMKTSRERRSQKPAELQWWNRWHTLPLDPAYRMESGAGQRQ